MLPPILEIYVLWHPKDGRGAEVAQGLLAHFRGSAFSGLIGGAVEVYVRSVSPESSDEVPALVPALRPLPYEVLASSYTAVVVVAGDELAFAAQTPGPWREYLSDLSGAATEGKVLLLPVAVSDQALDGTVLAELVGWVQQVAARSFRSVDFLPTLCRDVSQAITQWVEPENRRLQVFLSHTKHPKGNALPDLVRAAISDTRLRDFFDARDLQPGEDWAQRLVAEASHSALLVVRTDLYSSRPWCQREVLAAKGAGMPVVVLDGLEVAEERGSFLMDHVPRIAGQRADGEWSGPSVLTALNCLVDECLKRALWQAQELLCRGQLTVDIDWWAPHAPEPATFAPWLAAIDRVGKRNEPIIVLHPDPPLGEPEIEVLEQMARLSGLEGPLSFLTPRGLAVRGG